ncbi:hypothetical protein N8314_00850 [Akkermansiaceae bacterium]|nr:hypothetical protein [Akkermansiaceae bacterium]
MKYTREQTFELYEKLNDKWLAVEGVNIDGDILYEGWVSIDDMQEALIIIEEFDKENGIKS